MQEITMDISWVAVVVGAVVSFLVGWLWYSPKLFGTGWAEGVGAKLDSADKMPADAMISQIVGLLLMSWFVGVTAAHEMLLTVILATVAFAIMGYAGSSFAGHSRYARLVSAGYWIVALVIMVICQGIF